MKVCLLGFRFWVAGSFLPTLGRLLQTYRLRPHMLFWVHPMVSRPLDLGTLPNTQTRGLANSFGVFQTYYRNVLLPETRPSVIAWIGSIQICLMMLIGVFAGWLIDGGYLKFILIVGTTMTTLGMFMLSLCTKYWQILLAQAFCVGIGSGLLGLTSVAVIPLYFRRKRMLATGIAATGSSTGRQDWRWRKHI